MPEASELTLELLQSYYNVPLAELAKELGLSLTLLKKICRKFGIQRWPHRQIRSLNKNAQGIMCARNLRFYFHFVGNTVWCSCVHLTDRSDAFIYSVF